MINFLVFDFSLGFFYGTDTVHPLFSGHWRRLKSDSTDDGRLFGLAAGEQQVLKRAFHEISPIF